MTESERLLSWIEEHKNESTDKLLFRLHGKATPLWIDAAISHIDSLKKSADKFVVQYRDFRPDLLYPALAVEQSTSATVASLHAKLILKHLKKADSEVLDLTCGLGMDTRMLVEEAARVTAVELDHVRFRVALFNFRNFTNVRIVNDDCREFIRHCGHFDAAIIDPARRSASGGRIYNIRDCEPDVTEMMDELRKHTDYLLVKLSPMLDITETLRELPLCTALNIIGHKNECVELLAELDFLCASIPMGEIPIHIFQTPDEETPFTFTLDGANKAVPTIPKKIEEGAFVYLPSAVTMKSGAFNLISQRLGLDTVATNTHIFHSKQKINFNLGKTYKVINVLPFSSSIIKRISKEYPKGDVLVKNFGMGAEELKSRLKIKSGEGVKILGYRNSVDERKLLVLTSV